MWPFRKPAKAANNMDHMLAATIAKADMRRLSPGMFTINGVVWGIGQDGIVSQGGTFAPLSDTALSLLIAHLDTRPEVTRH